MSVSVFTFTLYFINHFDLEFDMILRKSIKSLKFCGKSVFVYIPFAR